VDVVEVLMALCERCDRSTTKPENEFGEFICEDCEQNAAEAAWERFCENFHGGSDPLTIREKQIAAWRLK
jgi:ribosomal protein L37AE/L43A